MRPRRGTVRSVSLAGLALAAALTMSACGGHGGASGQGAGGASATPSGLTQQAYDQMSSKVGAADSAISAADSDGTSAP